jgi:hypothetical protein
MSRSQRADGTVQYGIREFDLSTDRNGEQNYELIQAPNTRVISTIDVPDKCFLHFGSAQSPGLDLRDYSLFERETAFGQVYLSNPTGATGTLRLLFGVDLDTETEGVIDTVENISSTVTTDLSDDITRSVGVVRDETNTALNSFQYTTSSTSAEQVDSNSVPNAATVTVQADPANSSDINVGGSTNQAIVLSAGDSVGDINVDNTDTIHVNAGTSGDSVNILFES